VKHEAWRIVKARHAAEAFNGEGPRRYGGRWTSPGVAVVYAAEHASLAVLEVLVHLGSSGLLPSYVITRCEFDPKLTERISADDLPRDWRVSPPLQSLRAIGDHWVFEGRSAVLDVPSAVLPIERNYLLNPGHADFKRVLLGEPQAFAFDPRLGRRGA